MSAKNKTAGNVTPKSQSLLRQAVKLGQLPAYTNTAMAMQALYSFMVGIMHEPD